MNLDRYVRQMRYPPIGREGQERLFASRALVCGCGALGSVSADALVRAGVGRVRIVDRDFVETSNLQRQVLFDEEDVALELPKAIAAAAKLRKINSQIEVEAIVADLNSTNVEELCDAVDVILDGTDNFETRFLINDLAVCRRIPWVYGGCIGAEGQTMTVLPGETPCLRCLMEECPPPGTMPTCDTAGIVGPVVSVIASIQAIEGIKILCGHREAISRTLTVVRLWEGSFRHLNVSALPKHVDCPTCTRGEFPWLSGKAGSQSAILCGRNAVQLTHAAPPSPLPEIAKRFQNVGQVTLNPFLLRLKIEGYEITIFPDGRAIVGGTTDVAVARTVYAKYIGN
ncbi:MAG: ThiF family adenylyltransferase [Thermoguttaceae bacterium]